MEVICEVTKEGKNNRKELVEDINFHLIFYKAEQANITAEHKIQSSTVRIKQIKDVIVFIQIKNCTFILSDRHILILKG